MTATSAGVGPRPRVQPVPVLGDLVHEHALGRAAALDGEGDAEPAEDLDLGLVPEDLGVDEQPVHVEDGRGRTGPPERARRWSSGGQLRLDVTHDGGVLGLDLGPVARHDLAGG